MMLSRALMMKCGLAFASAALAASFIARDDEPGATAAAPAAKQNTRNDPKSDAARVPASTGGTLDLSLLNRAPTTELEENVFAVPRPPAPPPPPPRPQAPAIVVAAPPPKPTAPPLPFRFLGTMIDRGTTTLFVAQGAQNLSIKTGDVVGEVYRLEQIGDTNATFVYIPLQERQTLSMGNRN